MVCGGEGRGRERKGREGREGKGREGKGRCFMLCSDINEKMCLICKLPWFVVGRRERKGREGKGREGEGTGGKGG